LELPAREAAQAGSPPRPKPSWPELELPPVSPPGLVRNAQGIGYTDQQLHNLPPGKRGFALRCFGPVLQRAGINVFRYQYCRTSISPASWTVTMCGWFSDEAICASRWKRRRSATSANSSESNFTATGRSSFVSSARYTSPIPPAPIGAMISYGPSFVPAAKAIEFE